MGVEIVLPPWGSEVVSALTNPEILVCTFGYLFLPALCRRTGLIDTSKGAYRRAMVSYNVLMAVYSFGCFLLTGVSLGWDRGHGQWIRDLTGDKPTTLFTNQCPSPLMENKIFMWVAWSFYYSKYVEYLDTVWLVLKDKPVSLLQTFHHFGAPWDVYLAIVLKNEGMWIFVSFNSFIHTVMYTYFSFTAAGIRVPAKPLITVLQICQFVFGFILVYPYYNVPCYKESQAMMFSWVYNYAYVGGVLALFLHFFYQDNFTRKTRKDAPPIQGAVPREKKPKVT